MSLSDLAIVLDKHSDDGFEVAFKLLSTPGDSLPASVVVTAEDSAGSDATATVINTAGVNAEGFSVLWNRAGVTGETYSIDANVTFANSQNKHYGFSLYIKP